LRNAESPKSLAQEDWGVVVTTLFLKVLRDDDVEAAMARGAAAPIRREVTRMRLAIEKGEARGRATTNITSISSSCALLRCVAGCVVGAAAGAVCVVGAVMGDILATDEPMMS
jgi:hypothetical protein